MSITVAAVVFGVIALAELPDKSMVATLVMGSRNRPLWVWLGASAGFLVHVAVATGAGRLIELLPHQVVEIVVTVLFFAGALYLLVVPEWTARRKGADEAERAGTDPTSPGGGTGGGGATGDGASGLWKVAATAFGVVLLGEIGDLTEILILNFVAKYHQPWSVFVGGFAALTAMAAVGAFGGKALLRWLPLEWIRRAGGIALLGFTAWSIYGLVA